MKKLILSFLMLLPAMLFAQDTVKTLIRAGKVFNSETGNFQLDMAIIVSDSKIEAIKLFKEVSEKEKKGYKLIDLSKYTVLPGLIDAHTHLLYKETIIPDNNFRGSEMMGTLTMDGDPYRALYGSVKAKAYLEAGITSVQDLGNSGQFADIALRRAIDEGLVIGPRMRCAGQGLSPEGGQIPGIIYKHRNVINDEYRIVLGVADAIQAVRENITQGADVIKIFSSNTPNVTTLSVDEMQAIVKEAHRHGVKVTAHATSNKAIYDAVISGVDGIEHGYRVEDSTLTLMAKKGVVLVPTDGDRLTYVKGFKLSGYTGPDLDKIIIDRRKRSQDRLLRAIKNGVTIVFGSDDYIDFEFPFAESSKRTLIAYSESGMAISEILKASTINAARHLNWGDKLGVIKEGYLADIIAVDSDLEKNINAILNVHFVMKDGKVYVNN
ncbi:MAG TPA: amidohydrolase family protein [Chitinophagaceae bacterium]|nr:amidohydrolase family protein [Chitinophagaceae bacterium]